MIDEKLREELREMHAVAKSKGEKDRLLQIMKEHDGEDQVMASEAYLKVMEKLRGDTSIMKLHTGFPTLDAITEGVWEGNVILVSGPTKEGKTTFCQSLTLNMTEMGQHCLWFPFDTPGEELISRFEKKIDIYLPKANPSEKRVDWIERKIIEGIAKFDTRVIFIDHLGALSSVRSNSSNLATELQSIVRELKDVAIKWRVVIFLNHHIRKLQNDSAPTANDLKDSSGPGQEADMLWMIWRLKQKGEYGSIPSDQAVLSVQLNRRTGKTGIIKLNHKGDHFEEFSATSETSGEEAVTLENI